MKSNTFAVIILLVLCLPFTNVGCGSGGGNDFLPDPFSEFYGLIVDDLNNDGDLDIASTMHYFFSGDPDVAWVPVILNDPISPGNFYPADAYSVAQSSNGVLSSIASGDLNDDGLSDIVVEDFEYIFVLFQDSTAPGVFLNPIIIWVGRQITYLAVGDLNDDGFNDIAISGYNGPHLSILLQDAMNPGNFLPLVGLGIASQSVAIADIDGDFLNDIAIAGDGVVKLLFQDPAAPGSFFAPVSLNAGISPTDVKIGDLDNDGSPDLVVGNWGGVAPSAQGSVSVLLQDATNPGDFFAADDYNFGCTAAEVSLGDLNNDGLSDVAVASYCSSCKITILFQDIGNIGSFLPVTQYSCARPQFSNYASSIAIRDMNGDNFNDLIIAENGIAVRYQDPAAPGTFLNKVTIYNPS